MIVDDSESSIQAAVDMLRSGQLVAIPTETVYGLAADASCPDAVSKVFAAKGRPVDHPLIVHLGTEASLVDWAQQIPSDAYHLADLLWPGPLTMVLKRHPSVPMVVTGGLDTVALRMPTHPITQRILKSFGGGLAAPSANRFGRVSPTSANDVYEDLGDVVDLIVDGGPCQIGVESTIVSFDDAEVTILRPGAISCEELSCVLGYNVHMKSHSSIRVPGMMQSHYAPKTPLELFTQGEAVLRAAELISSGLAVGVLSLTASDLSGAKLLLDAGGELRDFARSLYSWLRRADAEALDVLVVELPPDEGLGVAIRDRLLRAAHR